MMLHRSATRLAGTICFATLTCFLASAQDLPAPFTKRLVAFYGSWSKYQTPPYTAQQIPYQKVTHIIHAGINLNEPADGSFTIPATGFVEPALLTKAKAAGVKVLFYVGANSGADYSAVTASAQYRATFVKDLKAVVAKYGYDGIDIDWEYPNGNIDKRNFVTFMDEIRAAFPKPFIISTDIPNYPSSGVNFEKLKEVVTWFNIMTYDEAGPWDGTVEMNSPIYNDPANPNPQGSVEQAANDFLNTYHVPAAQLNMGTPFYGYDYKDQNKLFENCDPCTDNNVPSYNYANFIENRINKNGWVSKWDSVEDVPYLVRADGGKGFITYDDTRSTYDRIYYSLWERGLGGGFMWEISADYDGHSQVLLEAMYAATLGLHRNIKMP